jgi:hypothetical protein
MRAEPGDPTYRGADKPVCSFGSAALDDILSQGGDDDGPGRWPRRLAVMGAPVLVAAASIGYLSLAHHAPSAAAARPASAASAAQAPAGLAEPGPPSGSDGIDGPTLPWTGGILLPVAGPQPTWFSPATGRSEAIGGLPADSAGYQFTRVAGGWAVQASPGGMTACGACDRPSLPVWFLADGARSVTRVGTANLVTPAATAGAVWLASEPPAAAVPMTAREVSLDGVPLGAPVRLPRGYVIDQATDRGLLLAPVGGQPGTAHDELWNPANARTVAAFGDVVAASPAEIAWAPPCAATCQVRLADLATGKTTAVGLPAGDSATSGAFSPDGKLLALEVGSGDGGATRLEVASVTSGRLTAVPGSLVGSNARVEFGWPASGDSLVAEFIFATQVQLASWHPGATRLAVADVRPAQDLAALVVG